MNDKPRDIHQERADAEGITRQQAKSLNYFDMYSVPMKIGSFSTKVPVPPAEDKSDIMQELCRDMTIQGANHDETVVALAKSRKGVTHISADYVYDPESKTFAEVKLRE